jgi:hypothetical protein
VPAAHGCSGAPRDLGRDQGAAARAALRARAGGGAWRRALDRVGVCEAPLARWRRELRRHFPHQHEWLEGAARAAGLPDLSLMRAASAELTREREAVLLGVESGGAVQLWRTAAPDTLLRRVAPDGRLASLELASPLLACPWLGVNQAGLGVAATGAGAGASDLAPALFARDCLERFEQVESALAWCLLRPVGAVGSILLADAHGGLAGVAYGRSGRSVRRPSAGALALGGARAEEVAKELAGGSGSECFVEAALARVLGDAAAAAAARVDPALPGLRPSRAHAVLAV